MFQRLFVLIKDKLGEIFGLDYRSLALFRMCAAGLILYDLNSRFVDLVAHYTDQGILPREIAIEKFWKTGFFSLHVLSGSAWFQSFLFILAGICAVCLFLGYRTRWATALSWFFLVSLQSRNSMILHGGDVVFRLTLFWAMFLPLGAKWSFDSVRRTTPLLKSRLLSTASFAFIVQLACIYIFNFHTKSDPIWREKFEAVYYALSVDRLTSDFGRYMLNFPIILKILTASTLLLEGFVPYLLLSPYRTQFLRLIVVTLFISFHGGLILSMELGFFPEVCIAAWLALLPTIFWDKCFGFMQSWPLKSFVASLMSKTFIPLIYSSKETPPFQKILIKWTFKTLLFFFPLICIAYVLMWNIRSLNFKKYEKNFPQSMNSFAYAFRLDQFWSMFAPRPLRDDGWYVIPATLKDGSEVDLFTQQSPVSWEKPITTSFFHENQRWRKYMRNIWLKRHASHRKYFSRYLCEKWNSTHSPEQQIERLKIYYMRENTLPDYKESKIRKVKLWTHNCQKDLSEQEKK